MRTSIPEPIFTPALVSEIEQVLTLDSALVFARNEQKQACADKYASRIRKLSSLIIQNKMDYADVAELLESEASELERQAQELI
ncbi:DUF2732 family protein [Proteus mirabilis]|uniref:DUF2732 family protein n=1 Tax=Proteus mirabilis TaxID=584 RepID=UPI002575A59C|nr:DUF2732 family protein [Proteus mirabilis]MDM3837610.1 DUF2732 family protein [Proteus mirabilis]HEJ0266467.1 DUF2732 family protein [Proteus mirabilis]HEK2939106.1 DUF2732 family protein [Proteus mirabilis]